MELEPSKDLHCKQNSKHMLLGCGHVNVASVASCSKDCWETVDMIGTLKVNQIACSKMACDALKLS